MRFVAAHALALAAGAAGFVLPDEKVLAELQPNDPLSTLQTSASQYWHHALDEFKSASELVSEGMETAKSDVEDLFDDFSLEALDPMGMIESEDLDFSDSQADKPPHHKHPHHKPHSHDLTVYQLLSKSKYTTKLLALIEEYDDIVAALNTSDAALTLFAPTDKAFEKIPDHAKKPSKEFLKGLLAYHTVHETLSAKDLLGVHTVPTTLAGDGLSDNGTKTPQRLSVGLGWKGVYVNKYVRVIYPNVFGSNGVVHATDSILVPPPPIGALVSFFPTTFSTLELALHKTGVAKLAKAPHLGATFFAPPNSAWRKLGPKLNAFLFSKFGTKYLRGLLKYHIVVNQTLYSDAYYGSASAEALNDVRNGHDVGTEDFPKGRFHVDLPTLLNGSTVGVDIGRYGGLISMHVNHFSKVVVQDAVAKDGVLHIINSILMPPKKHGHKDDVQEAEMSVEDFKERMDPFLVEEEDDEDDESIQMTWGSLEL